MKIIRDFISNFLCKSSQQSKSTIIIVIHHHRLSKYLFSPSDIHTPLVISH